MGPTLSTEASTTTPVNKTSSISLKENHLKKSKKETIFIFDWDDTLMCTSFISLKNQKLSKEEKNMILNLGEKVSSFIMHCKEYGKIIILTNSSENWVKTTSKENLGINDINELGIKIISTRDKYIKKDIDKKKWKETALNEIINKYKDNIDNIICASDSFKDINVFKQFMEKYKDINFSTIKFKRRPSPLIMIKEIKYLIECIDKIIGTNKNYYLMKEDVDKELKYDDDNNNNEFNFLFGNLFDYIFKN